MCVAMEAVLQLKTSGQLLEEWIFSLLPSSLHDCSKSNSRYPAAPVRLLTCAVVIYALNCTLCC